MDSTSTVLVTGGSGFAASHCIVRLLEAGHRVRTTVRNLQRVPDVQAMLRAGGCEPGDRVSFVAADLQDDPGWAEAASGCRFVMHVASPLPLSAPANEDELIRPARDGTLRVLRAARDAGVRRVVLTSSFAAVGYGHPAQDGPFDESTWTDLSGSDVSPYVKSKTLAERAAWDFIAREGGELELTTINPVAIFGPILHADFASSIALIQRMMSGGVPGCPRLYFGVVDVRDVADLHWRAMTEQAAGGQRFLAIAGKTMSLLDVAMVLRRNLGPLARRVPKRQLPNWLVRLAALRSPLLRQMVPSLGKVRSATSEKARRLLGWQPRSNEQAIIATAESLVSLAS